MTNETERKALMAKYLLARMSEQERSDFEKQYFADDELFDDLVDAETETIRSYLRGNGSAPERKAFESRFLTTPSRQRHFEFERSLAEYVSRHAPAQGAERKESTKQINDGDKVLTSASQGAGRAPAEEEQQLSFMPARFELLRLRLAAVAALLLLLVGGSWLVIVNGRISREIQQLRLEQSEQRLEKEQLRRQVAELDATLQQQRKLASDQQELIAHLESPHSHQVPFTLESGLSRLLGQQRSLVIPRGVAWVPLQLRLEHDEYPIYGVDLETAEGAQIWQQQNLSSLKSRNGKRLIALQVPAKLLESRTYILSLTGTAADGSIEKVADYTFSIVRP